MTKDQKKILSSIKFQEEILALSYWENYKFYKEMAQGLGGTHPMTRRLGVEVEEIRREWQACGMKLKEFLKAIGVKEEEIHKEIYEEGNSRENL